MDLSRKGCGQNARATVIRAFCPGQEWPISAATWIGWSIPPGPLTPDDH